MASFKMIASMKNVTGLKCILSSRAFATATNTAKNNDTIRKSVFISQSHDIYTNLALEDWIYKNFNLSNHHVLLLWRNSPCVVVGRHQNPWLETDEAKMNKRGVEIARRNSGGGAVYHDGGNLNLTFFTPRDRYRRRDNLEVITRALNREWNIEAEISPREDIVINGDKKISGTAAKLGNPNAYHHCTLLVNTNRTDIKQALNKDSRGITTNATRSTPSPVMNLSEAGPVRLEQLIGTVGYEYLRTCPNTLEDGGEEMITHQRGFQMINPTEYYFPGLNKTRAEFSSWEWRFGKTPEFTVTRSLPIPPSLQSSTTNSSSSKSLNKNNPELRIHLEVESGIVRDVKLHVPHGLATVHGDADVVTTLRGKRYSEAAVSALKTALLGYDQEEVALKQ